MLAVVQNTLRQFHMIAPGDRVVVGVSGGADSVALFLSLCEYRKEVDFSLELVHVNHLIREDASEDAKFVEELAGIHGVSFHLFEIDVNSEADRLHMSTEEAGRKIRYDAMRSLNPTKIAVGHHSDDLAETVMLNLCRGTGIHGMAGIAPVQDDIIRPLLYVTRSDIEGYLDELCQPYRTDSTNLSDDYTRNKFRLKVLPYLNNEINDKTSEHIVNLSRDMAELEELLDDLTDKAYLENATMGEDGHSVVISKDGLHNLTPLIRRELILKAMEELTPRRKDITRNHVVSILDILDKNGLKRVSLPYNLEAVSLYDSLIIREKSGDCASSNREGAIICELAISPDSSSEKKLMDLPDGKTLVARIFTYDGKAGYPDGRYTKWFDYDKIEGSAWLRYRCAGDYLTVSDSLQRKSLKDYMINEKIPREERDKIYILADGDHVMWVPGYRISAYYKVSDKTRNILEISIK